jgi:hypothetical protein
MTWADDDARELAARRQAAQPARYQNRRTRTGFVPARAEPVPGTRTFFLEAITPGWVIYDNRTPDSGIWPAGVVTQIIHTTTADPETGELYPVTRYRAYNHRNLANPWTVLDPDHIDTSQGGYDATAASVASRQLLKPIVFKQKWDRYRPAEIEDIHDAWRLARAAAL